MTFYFALDFAQLVYCQNLVENSNAIRLIWQKGICCTHIEQQQSTKGLIRHKEVHRRFFYEMVYVKGPVVKHKIQSISFCTLIAGMHLFSL